jgi:hypothetical protein
MIEAAFAYRLLTSRAALTGDDGLDAINTTPLHDGALILVGGALYRLDQGSTATPDGLTVVAPLAGPGRWLFMAAGGVPLAVPNIAALMLLGVAAPDLIWVESVLCYWHRLPASVLAVDGITVVAAIGGGNWERIVPTTAPDWLTQDAWVVDPLTGDDENLGDAAAPLLTFDELDRRISTGSLRSSTTVTVPAGATVSSINLSVDNGDDTLSIVGTPTVVYTGVIDTYTDRNHATPVASHLTDAAIADFTPYVGMRLRVTSGSSAGAIAWIASANPGGAGLNVARVSRFGSVPAAATSVPAAVVPTHGTPYVIETLPIVNDCRVRMRNTAPGYSVITAQVGVNISSLSFQGDNASRITVEPNPLFSILLDGCSFDAALSSTPRTSNVTRCKLGGPTQLYHLVSGPVNYRFCLLKKSIAQMQDATWQLNVVLADGVTAGDAGVITQIQTYGIWTVLKLADVQIFDSRYGIEFLNAGFIWSYSSVSAGLSGNNNEIGVLIGDTDNEALQGQNLIWDNMAGVPHLHGNTADIRIKGTPRDIDLTWANVPFSSDEQKGVGTLAAGTATITARSADLRGVLVSRATPAGAPGYLSVPTATRAAGQFVVNSTSATDTSTFDWLVPAMARRIVIGNSASLSAPV